MVPNVTVPHVIMVVVALLVEEIVLVVVVQLTVALMDVIHHVMPNVIVYVK